MGKLTDLVPQRDTDTAPAPSAPPGTLGKRLNDISAAIRSRMTERIEQEAAFMTMRIAMQDTPYLFTNTINLIQGQTGVHKSRIASIIVALLLNPGRTGLDGTFIIKEELKKQPVLCYVDTERNVKSQLPFAMQQIAKRAGFDPERNHFPAAFEFTSLYDTPRHERMTALAEYLESLRSQYPIETTNLFVVLDVVTDCVMDFNKSGDSMALIDHLNMMVNNQNTTFLCIIHENPGSEKARGHLGTELANKSSTVMSIGLEKDVKGNDTQLIRVQFKKLRDAGRPPVLHLVFDQDKKDLVLADALEVAPIVAERIKTAAPIADVCNILGDLVPMFPATMTGAELVENLCLQANIKDTVAYDRLKTIRETMPEIRGKNFEDCYLFAEKQGKSLVYSLREKQTSIPMPDDPGTFRPSADPI